MIFILPKKNMWLNKIDNNMDISLQKINTTQNNQDYSGTILYLHYPNYINHSKNTFSGVVGNLWDKSSLSEKKIPVGHSAIILIDKFANLFLNFFSIWQRIV